MVLVSSENIGNSVVKIFTEESQDIKNRLEEFYYHINLLVANLSEKNIPVEKWFYTSDELSKLKGYKII